MVEFEKAWAGKDSGIRSRLMKSLKPKKEMRDKIGKAIRALDIQRGKLDHARSSLEQKDKRYFNKVVKALKAHRKKRAILYANEMVEVRKALRSINQTRLAIEQISLRLGTVRDVGDIVATVAPAMSVIKSVRGNLSRVIPKADEEFDILSDMLGSILVDAGQMGGLTLNFSTANVEADKILSEAEKQVEKEMRVKFPSVPEIEREGIRF